MQNPGLILVQSELGPQINPTDLLVRSKAGRGSALEDDAAVHDIRAVGNAQRFTDVVIRDQHADAAIPQVENDLLDILHRDRVDAGKRLVQQHELR